MIGLFTRLRARRDVHEAEPDERRTTLAEIEALLREIAAKPAEIDWTPNTSDSLGGEAFAARPRLAS
jgi:hypothetical protein